MRLTPVGDQLMITTTTINNHPLKAIAAFHRPNYVTPAQIAIRLRSELRRGK